MRTGRRRYREAIAEGDQAPDYTWRCFWSGATNRTRLSRCFATVSPKAIRMPEYLAVLFEERGSSEKAEQVYRDGIAAGEPRARADLAVLFEDGGPREGRAAVPGRHRRW